MRNFATYCLFTLGIAAGAPAWSDSKDMVVEIYRVAPGKHEQFLRQIALYDQANAEAGLPPPTYSTSSPPPAPSRGRRDRRTPASSRRSSW